MNFPSSVVTMATDLSGREFPVSGKICNVGELYVTSGIMDNTDKAVIIATFLGTDMITGEFMGFTGHMDLDMTGNLIKMLRKKISSIPLHLR